MPTSRSLGVAALLLCSGCATADEPPPDTRVAWMKSCPSEPKGTDLQPFSGALTAILAAVGPKLIDGAIDAAAGALKAAGETRSESSTAKTFRSFYFVNQMADLERHPDLSCLVLVRGKFASGRSAEQFVWADQAEALKGLQTIDFRFEARIQALRSLKSFQLVPVYAQLNQVQKRTWWPLTGPQKRDLNVSVALQVPGAASPFASASFLVRDLSEGQAVKRDDWRLSQLSSEPMAFPAPPADVEAAKARREAQLAPLLMAVDILKRKPTQVPDAPSPRPPSLYFKDAKKAEPGVQAALDDFCGAQAAFNAGLPDASRQLDARCAQRFELDIKRGLLERRLDEALRHEKGATSTGASREWALKVCQPKSESLGKELLDPVADCEKFERDDKLSANEYSRFTTSLTLVESRDGNKFLGFLGTALGASKEALGKTLTERWVPEVKDSAAEEGKARSNRRALALADLEVERAEQVLAEALSAEKPVPSAQTSARVALLKAKTAANDAYRAAGQPLPYPEVD
jgi:hypothetical protein